MSRKLFHFQPPSSTSSRSKRRAGLAAALPKFVNNRKLKPGKHRLWSEVIKEKLSSHPNQRRVTLLSAIRISDGPPQFSVWELKTWSSSTFIFQTWTKMRFSLTSDESVRHLYSDGVTVVGRAGGGTVKSSKGRVKDQRRCVQTGSVLMFAWIFGDTLFSSSRRYNDQFHRSVSSFCSRWRLSVCNLTGSSPLMKTSIKSEKHVLSSSGFDLFPPRSFSCEANRLLLIFDHSVWILFYWSNIFLIFLLMTRENTCRRQKRQKYEKRQINK